MDSLLQCAACDSHLYEPVTLSCGYTICRSCTPPLSSDATVFVCPAKQCRQKTHLFARNQPTLETDSTIQHILETLSTSLDITSLLCCPQCHHMLCEPVTTQCGHTICYGCLLKLKCQGKSCIECQSPLPQYNYLKHQASVNHLLEQMVHFVYPDMQKQMISSLQIECRSPLMTTGSIILPRQRTHLSLFKSSDLYLLSKALLYSNGSLYLPVVPHMKSTSPRYGTLLEIIGVEERYSPISGKAVLLNVLGRERIKVLDSEQGKDDDGMDITVATFGQVPIHTMDDYDIVRSTACDIEMMIRQLAEQDMTVVSQQQSHRLTTHVAGLLGRQWLEDMQQQQGQLPSPAKPDSLVWWVAVALPMTVEQRYRLLCSESLQHRLHLVLSWITQLSSQWQYCRHMANQALATVFDQQPFNKMV